MQDPTFFSWLLSLREHRTIKWLVPLVGVAAATVHYIAVKDIIAVVDSRRVWLLYLVQAVIILVAMALIELGPQPRTYPQLYPRGSRALEQFWELWPRLWVAWFVLYAALAAVKSPALAKL